MAEIINPEKGNKKSRRRIHVDMTPMVDLNFLLLMFFMFTSTFNKPNIMDLGLPAKGPSTGEIDDKNQITFILGDQNKVFYHQSNQQELSTKNLFETDFSGIKISKIIAEAKKLAPKPENFTVIIKPTEDANYKNFVDILDNLAISHSERYGIAEIRSWEEDIYKQEIRP